MNRPILLTTTLLATTSTALGATITVPGGAPSIQAAVNMASDGDLIAVSPGTYHESVDLLGKAVTLRGNLANPAITIIDAAGLGESAVLCMNGEWTDTVVEGFTMTGGDGTDIGGYTYGGGMYCRYASPTIRNCVFRNNVADAGGGLAVHGSYSMVSDCVFTENEALTGGYFGGGGLFTNGGAPKVVNCQFTNNLASVLAKGGGISLFLGFPEITNCLIAGNEARHGGGIMNQKSTAKITNCTIANNAASGYGGGLNCFYPTAQTTVTNCIVWNNAAATDGPAILDQSGAVTVVRYTDVEGGWSGAGSNNIDMDPSFVDPIGEDCRLSSASPCVDPESGSDDGALPEYAGIDLDGNPRIMNQAVDLGAYEFQGAPVETCLADFDANGVVEFDDLVTLLTSWGACDGCAADVDGNGAVEFDDLVALLTAWGACG
jgi:hypothetical protein